MEKNLKYSRTVTFGRFNIAHQGHVQLIQLMLQHGEVADVCVSSGKSNNDWDTRVLLLKHLCREQGVPLERVNFIKCANPFDAVNNAVHNAEFGEVAVVFGSDQEVMARKLADVYDTAVILNRRTNSSTQMRFFLDTEDFIEDLRHLYQGDEFAITLAKVLRQEELRRATH
jgi:nicotinamide mononucleotide adenylyltransferase